MDNLMTPDLQEALRLAERDLPLLADCANSGWYPTRANYGTLCRALLSLHTAEQDTREKEWRAVWKEKYDWLNPTTECRAHEQAREAVPAGTVQWRYKAQPAGPWQDAMSAKEPNA